ncbi:MAG TPA: adenylate/guanylate cyclase domain-containing protein, partial [Methylomirabilota bacterium]|nr:adenylate/guanylate cyclase domain-containing protein [Methylomirabilota bacterium]
YLCKRMAQRRRRFRFESRLRGLAEPPRWVVARGLIVYDGTRPVRVVGSLRDISAHKQALADLRDREARSRAILDTAMDAIISVDMNGRVVEFNPAATRIFGIPHEQAMGQSIGELIVPPQQQAAHAHGMRRFLETGKSTIVGRMIEVEAMHASGSLIPIEMSVAEVAGPSGRMFTAILRDISERKEFERQLSESEGKRARLARHFSPNMVNELMRGGDHLTRVQTRPIGVLFADIVGFTAMSQTMPGPDIIAMLRDFHALVENAVFSSDGTLDKYIGDGVMATFGTPRSGPRDATNAVDCALKLLNGVTDWNGRRQSAGEKPVQIGIGLHYGDATSGNVGSDKRLEFTVIGDTVNLASRIESLSRKLQTAIVASHDIVEAVRREGGDEVLIDFDDVGVHPIRGRSTPVRLWGMAAEAASKTAAR